MSWGGLTQRIAIRCCGPLICVGSTTRSPVQTTLLLLESFQICRYLHSSFHHVQGGDAMSPVENEHFIEIIMSRFRHPVDEVWGPVAPNVRVHLHELALAYSMASLADSLELAQEGLGKSLLTRFVDEPEGICPPYWPPIHWPPKSGA